MDEAPSPPSPPPPPPSGTYLRDPCITKPLQRLLQVLQNNYYYLIHSTYHLPLMLLNIIHFLQLTLYLRQITGKRQSILVYWRQKYIHVSLRTELINKQKLLTRLPQVSWIRHRDLHVLTVSSFTFTNDERFSAHRDSSTGDWVLVLRHPEPSDSGYYECSISIKPVTAISVKLEVVDKYLRTWTV